MVPAPFQSKIGKAYDLYFISIKNTRIHCRVMIPTTKEKTPALLMFHGYRGTSKDFSAMLPYVSEGYSVFALDCRGQGGFSQDVFDGNGNTIDGHLTRGIVDAMNGDKSHIYFRNVFLDTVQLHRCVTSFDFIDKTRIGTTGNSQGGGLAVACAALCPTIKCLAPIHPFLSDYKRVWEINIHKAYQEIYLYFRHYDPHHLREDEFFQALGYIDIKNMAKWIQAKTFFSTGLQDHTCPPSSTFAVYNNMKCERKMNIFYDFDHENMNGVDDEIFTFFKENL